MAEREKMVRYQAAQQAQQAQAAAAAPKPISAPPVEEQPAQAAPQPAPVEEKVYEVVFRIRVTKAQLDGLGAYMRANGIKPERVQI
jgi:hypothetical protein